MIITQTENMHVNSLHYPKDLLGREIIPGMYVSMALPGGVSMRIGIVSSIQYIWYIGGYHKPVPLVRAWNPSYRKKKEPFLSIPFKVFESEKVLSVINETQVPTEQLPLLNKLRRDIATLLTMSQKEGEEALT